MRSYHYSNYKLITPEFGSMKMMDVLPEHVRAWIKHMKDDGVFVATARCIKVVLSAIFTTALHVEVTYFHPCKGVRAPSSRRRSTS